MIDDNEVEKMLERIIDLSRVTTKLTCSVFLYIEPCIVSCKREDPDQTACFCILISLPFLYVESSVVCYFNLKSVVKMFRIYVFHGCILHF